MRAPRPWFLAVAFAALTALSACEDSPAGSLPVGVAAAAPTAAPPAGPAFKLAGTVRTIATGTIATGPRPTDAAGNPLPMTLVTYEQPLGNIDVVVLDAGFKQVPQVPKLKSDAGGRFELTGLPPGRTFVLEGRPAGEITALNADQAATARLLGVPEDKYLATLRAEQKETR